MTNRHYYTHAPDGEIDGLYFISAEAAKVLRDDGVPLRAGNPDPGTKYVSEGRLRPRPPAPTRLNGATLLDVVPGSVVHINGQSYECAEGTVELEFEHPGTYTVRVQAWPYLDKEFTIENPPQ